MPKGIKKGDERHALMAKGLLEGLSATKAAQKAGYGKMYAKRNAVQIAQSQHMKEAMLTYARSIKPGELGELSKCLLHNDLLHSPRDLRSRLSLIRTGLEVDGQLGQATELHLHQHQTLPPKVQEMLEAKMAEMLQLKGNVIDAERTDSEQGVPDGAGPSA